MTTDERSADQSAEAQVRAYWKPESVKTGAAALHLSDYCSGIIVGSFECQNWDAALAFTLEHQEQCRCLEQEIFSWNEQIDSDVSVLRTCYEIDPAFGEDLARVGRTVERLQAALSELRRGVKEKA